MPFELIYSHERLPLNHPARWLLKQIMIDEQFLETHTTNVRVRKLNPNAIRVTHNLKSVNEFPAERPWFNQVMLTTNIQPGAHPELFVTTQKGSILITAENGDTILREKVPPILGFRKKIPYIDLDIPKTELRFGIKRSENGVQLKLGVDPDESFYGWGEWFNTFQRQSGRFHLQIRDAIALLQGSETYSAIPVFLSSKGYAFWLLNSHTSRWHLNRRKGEIQIKVDGPGADYILIYGPSYKRIIKTYTDLSGRPPLLPRWAFGLFVTGYPQESQDIILSRIERHRLENIPLDGVILDYHWEEKFHNFKWRRSLFPDPELFIQKLKQKHIHLGLILTPFLNIRNRPFQKNLLNKFAKNIPPSLERDDERVLLEYEEARKNGYLAHPNAKWWFGAGGMLDFSNPSAAAWWNDKLWSLYDQGVDFFKNDDGEYLPEDSISQIGMNGYEYHNIYGFFYSKTQYEGMGFKDDRRPMVYARSAWAGSQRYPALFLGDQKASFDGIKSTLKAGLNLGLLGFAYWTADIFGLDGKTTPEIHARYAQWALMTPVARYFWRPPEIDNTRFPWSHNQQVKENFRKYTQLRYKLLPYYYMLAWESYQSGWPIVRPLMFEYQNDKRLAGVYDQVMLGESLMLCPVVEPGASSRKIILPQGRWYDFWSRQNIINRSDCEVNPDRGKSTLNQVSWEGPTVIDYPTPFDCMPILVKGGSIIPMGPAVQYISQDHRFDQLQIHIWPPYPAQCILYNDDGRTQAYQRGSYSITKIQALSSGQRILVTIHSAEGNFTEQMNSYDMKIIAHHLVKPDYILLNGTILESWDFTSFSKEVEILVKCPIHKTNKIEIGCNDNKHNNF